MKKRLILFLILAFVVTNIAAADPNRIGRWWFDEGAGIIAYDSARSNHGTLINGPTWTTGQIGGALQFNGVDNYVEIPNSSSLQVTNAISVAVWAKTSSFDVWRTIVSKDQSGSNEFWLGYTSSNKLDFKFNGQNGIKINANTVITDSDWHHLVGVYDGNDIYVFVDGILDSTPMGYVDVNDNTGSVNIAYTKYWATAWFDGLIDEVFIYNRSLTEGEIYNLYTATRVAIAHTDVSIPDANNMISSNDDLIIVDIREPDEYCGQLGHIGGAYLYPWDSGVFQNSYEDFSQDDEILLVCRLGGRSHSAANFLDSKGYLYVYDLLGGTTAWKDTYGTVDCVDTDGDGLNDDLDNCPDVYNLLQTDSDDDRIGNVCDNCPTAYNPAQIDSDNDGIGNVCDNDCPNLDKLNPVNFAHFSILASNWQLSGPDLTGDLNADEVVDVNDLAILAYYWLGECLDCTNLDELHPVNFADFAMLASNWLLSGPDLVGDLNTNGIVDINDLEIFTYYWLSECYELTY